MFISPGHWGQLCLESSQPCTQPFRAILISLRATKFVWTAGAFRAQLCCCKAVTGERVQPW